MGVNVLEYDLHGINHTHIKKLFIFIGIALMLTSCIEEKPPLYLETNDVIKKDGVNIGTKSTKLYTDTYIELELASLSESNDYITSKRLKAGDIDSQGVFTMLEITVTYKDGEFIPFKSNTEFLNFMADRGYSKVSGDKNKYGTSLYTFKKE